MCYTSVRNDCFKHIYIHLLQFDSIMGVHFKEPSQPYHLILSINGPHTPGGGGGGRSSVPAAQRCDWRRSEGKPKSWESKPLTEKIKQRESRGRKVILSRDQGKRKMKKKRNSE